MIEELLAFLDIEALMEDGGIQMHDGRWKIDVLTYESTMEDGIWMYEQ